VEANAGEIVSNSDDEIGDSGVWGVLAFDLFKHVV